MIPTTNTTLSDFFADTFRPDRLAGKNQRYVDTYRRAIEWLRMTLDREPTVADLTAANIRATMRTVHDAGCRSHWVSKMRARLSSLWKFAQRIGIVDNYQAVPMLDLAGQHAWMEAPPEAGTVRDFYMREYRPALGPAAKSDTDAAVKALDKMLARYVTLEEISHDLLVDFGRWLTKHRKSRQRIERYTASIRQIVRAWNPERFPLRAGNPNEPLPTPERGTLREFFERVYIPQRMLDATEMGIYQSRQSMRRLHEHYQRDVRLAELDNALLCDHMAWLKNDEGLRNVSINSTHRASILAVARYAEEVGEIDRAPRVKKLKETTHEPDSWSLDDMRALLAATSIYTDKWWRGPVPMDLFWRAIILTEWYTGVRVSSLFSIRQADVDLSSGMVYVRPENAKNRRGKRHTLGDDALAAVRAIWDPQRELLFAFPYSRESRWRQFRRIIDAAGVPGSVLPTSKFHKLRRTVATQAAVHGGMECARRLMDHSGMATTKRYVDPSRLPAMDSTTFLPRLLDE